jgi:hypothetical protein
MKRLFVIGLCWVIGAPVTAQLRYGNTVTISEPVWNDLYIAGGHIIINAPVHGDLVVAGGTVHFNDTVTNDILVAGGNVTFNGHVGDDVRCAGGNLQIIKNVAGDVVVTGGTVTIASGVSVGGLLSAGGEVTIDGIVTGKVKSASGNFVLNGQVMNDLDCRADKITINGAVKGQALLSAGDVIVGDHAAFSGPVRYWVPGGQVNFKQSLKNGQAVYDPSLRISRGRWYFLGFASIMALLWYVGAVLLLIVIIQYLFGPAMKKAGEKVYSSIPKSLGYGFLFWIGVPIAAAVAFITVIGVPVGLILLGCYIILALSATTIVAVVAANWLHSRSRAKWGFWKLVFIALGIFMLLKIVTFTPFFGWLLLIVLVCIASGAILLSINWRRKPVTTRTETQVL